MDKNTKPDLFSAISPLPRQRLFGLRGVAAVTALPCRRNRGGVSKW
jgi:hypothetical protein